LLRGDAIALLANSEADNLVDEVSLNTISKDTAVWHNSFIKDSFFTERRTKFSSPSQIGITEVGISEIDFAKSSVPKYGSSQINLTKVTLTENSIGKVSPFQTTSAPETTFIHTRPNEFSETQVSLVESASQEVGIAEVSFSVDTTSNYFVNPVSIPKATSSEIFFSPSVLSNQFFSIHNSTPQTINNINSIAQNFWNSYLNPQTPLNINLLLTDLPTGQLAEAQITKFDPSGRPNGGTLLIDHNANGIGWYIDPTPLDNSEFNQPLGDTVRSLERVVRSPLVKLNKYLM